MKKWEEIKSLIVKKDYGNSKKKIENLVVFLVILIITIIAINSIWKSEAKDGKSNEENNTYYKQLASNENNSDNNLQESELEKRLEKILSKIEGVGKVNVMLTYMQNSEIIPVYNETSKDSSTQETDSNGGTRNIKEIDSNKEVVFQSENGQNVLITKTILNPKIEGVIITAQGASNANVRANIIQAVGAVTGVATYKIQVFEYNS